jgi:hypothetical protein
MEITVTEITVTEITVTGNYANYGDSLLNALIGQLNAEAAFPPQIPSAPQPSPLPIH